MQTDFKGNEEKGGIYKITNIKNEKFYIGSARNFKKRACQHEYYLRNNKHANKHLQASWNKYGEEAFVFEVVEIVEGNKGERYKVEQQYIDNLIKSNLWEKTFNISKKADQKERSCWSSTPEESRRKRSEVAKRNAKKFAKTYQFVSPDGIVTTITNLRDFCRKHPELHYGAMHNVWNEKIGYYKGYRKYNPSKSWGKRNKPVYQYNFDGVLIKKWSSVKEAAREFGCTGPNIAACARGEQKIACNFVWKFDPPKSK